MRPSGDGACLRRMTVHRRPCLRFPFAILSRQGIHPMSVESESEDANAEREADRKSEAMKSQLRDDVNSWAKARSEASPGHIPGQIAAPKASLGRAISPRP